MKKLNIKTTLPKTTGALMLGLCTSHAVLADQTPNPSPDIPNHVIYDNQIDINAENAKVKATTQADIDDTVNQSEQAITTHTQKSDNLLHFPVTTKLTLGVVENADHPDANLYVAFFVIGDDPASLAWVEKHKAQIKQSHVVGYVTQVASKARFDAIRKQTGLLLMPITADPLAKVLNVQHYPFFYSHGKVSQ